MKFCSSLVGETTRNVGATRQGNTRKRQSYMYYQPYIQ